MQYFIMPIFFIIFCELLGNTISNKYLNTNFTFNTIVGFSTILGIYYIICFPLVIMHAKFTCLFIITSLFLFILLIWLINNRKYLNLRFTKKNIFIFLLIDAIQLYFSSRNTIGNIYIWDTINYSNLVTGYIYGDGLNTMSFMNGNAGSEPGYMFQAYYILASYFYYIINGICSVLHVNFFYFTEHTWFYTLVLYCLFSQMIINFIQYFELKKIQSYLLISFFIILFMGNFYWNSEQAYLGNSFRMILVSYSLIYIRKYVEDRKVNNLILFSLIHLCNCACAASNTTLLLIMVFGIWAFIDFSDNDLKIIIGLLIFPLFNMVYQIKESYCLSIMVSIIIFILLIYSDKVNLLTYKMNLKKIVPIFVLIILVISSLFITHNPFDFDAFLNNMSGISDMTWDYTDWSNLWRALGNVVYCVLVLLAYVVNREDTSFKALLAIAIIFFNPFSSPIQNKYMIVFYRNYDICINYFVLFIGIKTIETKANNKVLLNVTYSLLILSSLYAGINQLEYHPDSTWEKDEDYNSLLRMENSQADALLFVKDLLINNGITYDIKAVSSILQVRTEMPWIKTLYSRNKVFAGGKDDWNLYTVLYPSDYYGDKYIPEGADYSKMCEYLDKTDYRLIIQDKKTTIYDEESNTYYSITYLIDRCGGLAVYENDRYSVYFYD